MSITSNIARRLRSVTGILTIGTIADGEYLKRDGDTIVGAGGGGVGLSVDETELAFTDVVTANSSSTKHGLLKKLSNVATEALDGQGAWSTIATILGFTPANDADVVHDTGDETVAGVKTFSSDPIIPDEAYGVGWNGSLEPPTKNAVYDKVETLGAAGIGGSTGATDNAILRADGTGGATLQNSGVTIDDTGNINAGASITLNTGNPAVGFVPGSGTTAYLLSNGNQFDFYTNQPRFTIALSTGNVTAYGSITAPVFRPTPTAFASLPASPLEGMMVWVSDSSTATWGDTIAGGGANKVLAVYNGTNWTVTGK